MTLVFAVLAIWNLGAAVYIQAKAGLAQVLMEQAWARTLDGAREQRPWAWADTWPVARLRSTRHGADLIVLEGASGRNLAFGPAHISATPTPGAIGNSVISGHRDTHFAWLEQAELHDEIVIESTEGTVTYTVRRIEVVHETDLSVTADTGGSRLTLVTCYPFNAVRPGTPPRYVVTAER